MALAKIRKGDEVAVIAGRDKGKRGTVLKIAPSNCVLVEGVNLVTHYVKRDPQKNVQGGLQRREAPIAISNVLLVNPATGKGERVGVKILDDGSHVRWFRKSDEMVQPRAEERSKAK